MTDKFLLAILFIFIFSISSAVYAQIDNAHKAAGVSCADCHKTDAPAAKAPSSSCKECHGEMQDSKKLEFKDIDGRVVNENPHSAHPGAIRCTLCHASHKPSQLFCNTGCHHTFELQVP